MQTWFFRSGWFEIQSTKKLSYITEHAAFKNAFNVINMIT